MMTQYKTGTAFKWGGVEYLALDDGRQCRIWRLPDLFFCYAWESIASFKKNARKMAPELFPGTKCVHCDTVLPPGEWQGQECQACASV